MAYSEKIKLSIIIPVYNVEQYLRKCIDSVLNQDYEDYEIILVDDGSLDSCPAICDSYASNYENIKVIHRKNGGLSAARNSGIEVARGEYIMFIDSDDYIEQDVLRGLILQIERDKLDVLRYRLQYVRLTSEREYEIYNPYKSDPFKGNNYSEEPIDGVSFLNARMGTACYAWAFVFRRELLDGCLFTEGIYFEDTDWTPRMLTKAKRVASANTIVYNYLVREGSITNAVNRDKQKKVLDDKMRLIGEMQKQSGVLEQKGLSGVWYSRMIADTVISIMGIISVDFYELRIAYLDALRGMNVFPISKKSIKARLINFSPRIAVAILHLKNRK